MSKPDPSDPDFKLYSEPFTLKNPFRCRSCGAPMAWAVTPNGKTIPLDAKHVPDGNLWLDQGVARTVNMLTPGDALRYKSHFATCPNADEHRRKR